MLKIGGQRVPPKTLLMAGSDGSFIVLGLLLAAETGRAAPWLTNGDQRCRATGVSPHAGRLSCPGLGRIECARAPEC